MVKRFNKKYNIVHPLDLHGVKHANVVKLVEDYLFQNQEECPLLIICGNSQKMISLVTEVLKRVDCVFEEGKGHNYGTVIVRKV